MPAFNSIRTEGDLAKFDHTRFLDSKAKRYEEHGSIPFSYGNRTCLGQHSAMISTKLFTYQFLKEFDLRKDENANYNIVLRFLSSVDECSVMVRNRK